MICLVCGKEEGIALFGRLPGDKAAPKNTPSAAPCPDCQKTLEGYKEKGIVMIIIDDSFEAAHKEKCTPWMFYRGLAVLTDESAQKTFSPDSEVLEKRIGFIAYSLAKHMGMIEREENSNERS